MKFEKHCNCRYCKDWEHSKTFETNINLINRHSSSANNLRHHRKRQNSQMHHLHRFVSLAWCGRGRNFSSTAAACSRKWLWSNKMSKVDCGHKIFRLGNEQRQTFDYKRNSFQVLWLQSWKLWNWYLNIQNHYFYLKRIELFEDICSREFLLFKQSRHVEYFNYSADKSKPSISATLCPDNTTAQRPPPPPPCNSEPQVFF